MPGIPLQNVITGTVSRLCCRTRFNRTKRTLLQVTELFHQKPLHSFPIPVSHYFVIDSLPLLICKSECTRYFRSLHKDRANYKKVFSKKRLISISGYRVHV